MRHIDRLERESQRQARREAIAAFCAVHFNGVAAMWNFAHAPFASDLLTAWCYVIVGVVNLSLALALKS